MEEKNYHKIWEDCYQSLQKAIPENDFLIWFSPIAFHSYANNQLILECPNKFIIQMLSEQYGKSIKEAINHYFGENARISFKIAKSEPANFSQRELEKDRKGTTIERINPNLDNTHTLSTFIKGEANKLTLSVGESIINNPFSTPFNPFFIYGPSGVGKTHLVNAIGLEIYNKFPDKQVIFVSAHVFLIQYTDSVRNNKFNDFIHFYQSIDVLIIDDIQEITTPKTQQAFFHIFNHLKQNGKEIILTCDRAPSEFEGIEERMLTRFKSGMIAEMYRPDEELRRAILISKIKRDNLEIPKDVIDYIARNVASSVRELEGILTGIMAYSIADNSEITLERAKIVIQRSVKLEKNELTADDIISTVCKHCGCTKKEALSKSRKSQQTKARQIAMYLCHKYAGMSYAEIGRQIGKRDHSTVMYSCSTVGNRISTDKNFRKEIETLELKLKH